MNYISSSRSYIALKFNIKYKNIVSDINRTFEKVY